MDLAARRLACPALALEPFRSDQHRAVLEALMRADADMFAFWPAFGPGDWISSYLDNLTRANETGDWISHACVAPDGAIVGSTSFMAIERGHKRVEIGATWYARSVHGTRVNPAAKLLMFTAAFEAGANRVELKVDARNARSRAAVLKLGAKQEGVFRRHMVLPSGHVRDTVYYSVIAEEWPAVRAGLEARIKD